MKGKYLERIGNAVFIATLVSVIFIDEPRFIRMAQMAIIIRALLIALFCLLLILSAVYDSEMLAGLPIPNTPNFTGPLQDLVIVGFCAWFNWKWTAAFSIIGGFSHLLSIAILHAFAGPGKNNKPKL